MPIFGSERIKELEQLNEQLQRQLSTTERMLREQTTLAAKAKADAIKAAEEFVSMREQRDSSVTSLRELETSLHAVESENGWVEISDGTSVKADAVWLRQVQSAGDQKAYVLLLNGQEAARSTNEQHLRNLSLQIQLAATVKP
jgi:hypothetical protein